MRSRLSDFFQGNLFHLIDITFDGSPMVFSPAIGFSEISGIETTFETMKVQDGTYPHKIPVMKGVAETSAIRLARGCIWYDFEMWYWASQALRGEVYAKNLMLIHFLNLDVKANTDIAATLGAANAVAGIGSAAFSGGASASDIAASVGFAAGALSGKVPGVAWKLSNCIPSVYRGVSDFDAMNATLSVQELTVEFESAEPLTLFG